MQANNSTGPKELDRLKEKLRGRIVKQSNPELEQLLYKCSLGAAKI